MVRLRAIDGWRGIGAVVIALGHLEVAGLADIGIATFKPYVLVDYFFVLSGFVIAMVYADRLADRTSVLVYLVKRTGRIWPLHAAVLGLFIAVELAKLVAVQFGHQTTFAPFTAARPPEAILPTLMMLHASGLDDGLTWNFPSWSVAAEFWSYVTFGALMLVVGGRSRRLLVAAALTAVVCAAVVAAFSPHRMNATYDFGAVRALYGFMVGVLAEAAWRKGWTRFLGGTLQETATAIAVLGFSAFVYDTPLEYLAPPIFAVMILVFVGDRGAVSRLLSTAPFQILGMLSYSIYMVHAFVLTVAMPLLAPRVIAAVGGNLAVANRFSITIYLLLVLGLSAATFRFVERPGQMLFASIGNRLKARRTDDLAPEKA